MTTRVIVLCPENNHQDVLVTVLGAGGIVATHHVAQGQAKEVCVHDGARLEVTEAARKVPA